MKYNVTVARTMNGHTDTLHVPHVQAPNEAAAADAVRDDMLRNGADAVRVTACKVASLPAVLALDIPATEWSLEA